MAITSPPPLEPIAVRQLVNVSMYAVGRTTADGVQIRAHDVPGGVNSEDLGSPCPLHLERQVISESGANETGWIGVGAIVRAHAKLRARVSRVVSALSHNVAPGVYAPR